MMENKEYNILSAEEARKLSPLVNEDTLLEEINKLIRKASINGKQSVKIKPPLIMVKEHNEWEEGSHGSRNYWQSYDVVNTKVLSSVIKILKKKGYSIEIDNPFHVKKNARVLIKWN